jgi:hypothetical protein
MLVTVAAELHPLVKVHGLNTSQDRLKSCRLQNASLDNVRKPGLRWAF